MDSIASFHLVTGEHCNAMLPADWSISTHMTLLPSVSMVKDAMESVYNYVLCYFYQYPILRRLE